MQKNKITKTYLRLKCPCLSLPELPVESENRRNNRWTINRKNTLHADEHTENEEKSNDKLMQE